MSIRFGFVPKVAFRLNLPVLSNMLKTVCSVSVLLKYVLFSCPSYRMIIWVLFCWQLLISSVTLNFGVKVSIGRAGYCHTCV